MAALLPAAWPSAAGGVEISIGLGAGYFIPVGDWKTHRYADVDQFTGHIVVQGDLEFRWSRLLGFELSGGYLTLSTGDWEDYAASQGDAVDASAYVLYWGVDFKPHLLETEHSALSLLAGLNVCFPSGQERFENMTYNYDFLKYAFGLRFGLEFERDVSRNIALMASFSSIIMPGSVEYADGLSYTIATLPLTAGIRFRF